MKLTISMHDLFEQIEPFTVDQPIHEPGEQANWCGYARGFHNWLERWVLADNEYTLVTLNQAKLILLDKYLEWRSVVPKSHQNRINNRGHICIYHIFIRVCEDFKLKELQMQKPMLFIPLPPPPPVVPPRFEPKGPMLFLGPEVEE